LYSGGSLPWFARAPWSSSMGPMGERARPRRRLFGRYRLERRIGRGGMAEVWQAHDDRLDRTVALKLLKPSSPPDEASRRRFVAEARAASGLTHPGIVPAYDVVDDPSSPAIVFQHVDGESLAERLRRGPVPIADAVRIASQVAEALDHAHRAGVVHRDVKPANILLDRDGRARLVDFGIAQVGNDARRHLTGTHQVVGTLRYMAPEQLAGGPSDARTDLYALGLVLAELLPDLATVPDWLRELVARLRAADPADRPASAADVARALETGSLEAPDGPAIDAVDDDEDEAEDGPPTVALAVPVQPSRRADRPAPEPPVAPEPRSAGASRRASSDRDPTTDPRPILVAVVLTAVFVGALALAGRPVGVTPIVGEPAATLPALLLATAPPDATPSTEPSNGKGPGHGKGKP
jgi:serine/threonine-protein kinase